MRINPIETPKELLCKLYLKDGKSISQMSEELGVSKETLRHRMIRSGIPRRKRTGPIWSFKNISLTPTEDLGYFCGLVIGDGSIFKASSGNYIIQLVTTRKEFRDHFVESALKVSKLLKSYLYEHEGTRRFPNGSVRTDVMYYARIDSKVIHDALRPFKQSDYHWQVPSFLSTKEAKRGFLQGIFDAEATVFMHKNKAGCGNVTIASKHKSNLLQIKQLLGGFGVESYFDGEGLGLSTTRLKISNRRNLSAFARTIGFKLKGKQEKLLKFLSSYQKRIYPPRSMWRRSV